MNRTPKWIMHALSAVFALSCVILWASPSRAAREWTPRLDASGEDRGQAPREVELREGAPVESAIAPVGVQVDQAKHSGDEGSAGSPFALQGRFAQVAWLRVDAHAPACSFVDRVSARKCPAFLMVFLN